MKNKLFISTSLLTLSFSTFALLTSCGNKQSGQVGKVLKTSFNGNELHYDININNPGNYMALGTLFNKDEVEYPDGVNYVVTDTHNNKINVNHSNIFNATASGTYHITATTKEKVSNYTYYGIVSEVRSSNSRKFTLNKSDNTNYIAFEYEIFSPGAPTIIEGANYVEMEVQSMPKEYKFPLAFKEDKNSGIIVSTLQKYGSHNFHYSCDKIYNEDDIGKKAYVILRINNVSEDGTNLSVYSMSKLNMAIHSKRQIFIAPNEKYYFYINDLDKDWNDYSYYIQANDFGEYKNIPTRILDNDLVEMQKLTPSADGNILIECSPLNETKYKTYPTPINNAYICKKVTLDFIQDDKILIPLTSNYNDQTIEFENSGDKFIKGSTTKSSHLVIVEGDSIISNKPPFYLKFETQTVTGETKTFVLNEQDFDFDEGNKVYITKYAYIGSNQSYRINNFTIKFNDDIAPLGSSLKIIAE